MLHIEQCIQNDRLCCVNSGFGLINGVYEILYNVSYNERYISWYH